jgi:beta-barrel assembly-enhancing protease
LPEFRYAAFLLADHLAGGRLEGECGIDSESILFRSETTFCELPLRGLTITQGGSGNRLIYFSHPNCPGETFYTSDKTILKDPYLLAQREGLAQVKALHKSQRKALVASFCILTLFSLMLCGVFLLKSPLVSFLARQVPAAWENKLGDLVLAQVSLGKRVMDSGEALKPFHQVVEPMLNLPEFKARRLNFHIVNDASINAFAIPGGHVVIHTGLLQSAQSWDEVMGVIGHELAHLSHRHSLRNLMETAGLYLVVQSLLGDIQGLLAVLLDNGTKLLTLEYSRDFEREADDVGFGYIVQSGFNPEGLVTFFRKIKAEQERHELGSILNKSLQFISTHPATDERILAMEKRIAEQGQYSSPNDFYRPDYMAWRNEILLLLPETAPDTSATETATTPP